MNVLIVDDEPIIRQVLRTMIDWESEGLVWCGEAEDGQEAWEKIRQGEVDIVVTDILMPRMDGLELVRKLRSEARDAAIVVLSCLDDFQYVKEAMKLGASDYILKPTMEPESLVAVLREAKEALARDRSEAEELRSFRMQQEQSRQMQAGAELRRLLEAEGEDHVPDCALVYADNGTERVFDCCMVYLAAGFSWSAADWSSPDAFAVIVWDERQALLIFEQVSATYGLGMQSTLSNASNRLRQLINERSLASGHPCFISEARGVSGICGLKHALKRHRQEREQFFYETDCEILRAGEGNLPQEEKHNLLRAVAGGNGEAVEHWLKEIEERIVSRRPPSDKVYSYIQELLSLSAAFVSQQNEGLDLSDFEKEYLHSGAARYYLQFTPLFQALERAVTRLIELQRGVETDTMHSRNPFIRKAHDYMLAHYHLPISTTDIAEHVRLSRSYISDLYSKETGESLSEALTRIRMQAAKRLLRVGDRKVYEIAEAVGFSDAKAFAKTFKRMVGCTPKEYLEQK